MKRMKLKQQGFTLMEIMIAVSILGMIGTLSFGTLRSSVDARERTLGVTDHYHQVRQSMLRMTREIQSAFLSEHRDCEDPQNKTIFLGKRSSNGMRLDFTSFSHFKIRADANESDQNELSYFVDSHPDDSSRKALFRREQARIDEEPEEGGSIKLMAEDVLDIEFEFFDPQDKEWEDEWDSTSMDFKGKLPLFVKIQITALDSAGNEQKFTTKTRLFVQQAMAIPGITGSRCLD
jgi:general secretion pathway protein J